jgi:hypothetical protein
MQNKRFADFILTPDSLSWILQTKSAIARIPYWKSALALAPLNYSHPAHKEPLLR